MSLPSTSLGSNPTTTDTPLRRSSRTSKEAAELAAALLLVREHEKKEKDAKQKETKEKAKKESKSEQALMPSPSDKTDRCSTPPPSDELESEDPAAWKPAYDSLRFSLKQQSLQMNAIQGMLGKLLAASSSSSSSSSLPNPLSSTPSPHPVPTSTTTTTTSSKETQRSELLRNALLGENASLLGIAKDSKEAQTLLGLSDNSVSPTLTSELLPPGLSLSTPATETPRSTVDFLTTWLSEFRQSTPQQKKIPTIEKFVEGIQLSMNTFLATNDMAKVKLCMAHIQMAMTNQTDRGWPAAEFYWFALQKDARRLKQSFWSMDAWNSKAHAEMSDNYPLLKGRPRPATATATTSSSSTTSTGTGSTSSGGGKGLRDKVCEYHGKANHTTADCKALQFINKKKAT